MRLALIGYGKMGRMVEMAAREKGHEIVSIIDPGEYRNQIDEMSVANADVCIDFTNPKSAVDNILQLVSLKKAVVVGTTGWDGELPRIKKLVDESSASLFYAPNFSIGMNLFIKILQDAAKRIVPTGLYDIAGIEEHHNKKHDSPSGTAKSIARAISDAVDGSIEVPFTAVRCGFIPGTHTVLFDSLSDTITLTHAARDRAGFAAGAVAAAEWLKGKSGFYTMDDMLFSGEKICSN